MKYRRRETLPVEHEFAESISWNGYQDQKLIRWTIEARRKFKLTGTFALLHGQQVAAMPYEVEADSWHHVCAIVGCIEPIARMMYYHPEDGQPSAVAKAPPYQHGPKIYCQGEED